MARSGLRLRVTPVRPRRCGSGGRAQRGRRRRSWAQPALQDLDRTPLVLTTRARARRS